MKRGIERRVGQEGAGMKDMFLRENRESFYGDHFSPAIVQYLSSWHLPHSISCRDNFISPRDTAFDGPAPTLVFYTKSG